jgi:hypothetical protein
MDSQSDVPAGPGRQPTPPNLPPGPAAGVCLGGVLYAVLGPEGARAVGDCLETQMLEPPVDQHGWGLLCDFLGQLKVLAGTDPSRKFSDLPSAGGPSPPARATYPPDHGPGPADAAPVRLLSLRPLVVVQDPGWPVPGSRWRHWKGGLYRVIICYHDHATRAPRVVYYGEATGAVEGRALDDFTGKALLLTDRYGEELRGPRFVEVSDAGEDGGG